MSGGIPTLLLELQKPVAAMTPATKNYSIHQINVTIITTIVSLITITHDVSQCLFVFFCYLKHIYGYPLTYISSNATLHCNEFVTSVTYKTGGALS